MNENLLNRPGRLFYKLEFAGLDVKFVRAYCQDNLINKTHLEQVCSISRLFSKFSFDLHKALVEEMNRYGEGPSEALRFLNARPDLCFGQGTFDITIRVNGTELAHHQFAFPQTYCGDIFRRPISIMYKPVAPQKQQKTENLLSQDPESDPAPETVLTFTSHDLVKANSATGSYEYENKSNHPGVYLVLTKRHGGGQKVGSKKRGGFDLDHYCSVDNIEDDASCGDDWTLAAWQVMDLLGEDNNDY